MAYRKDIEELLTTKDLIDELITLAHKLDPWYDVRQIKWYDVSVWSKEEDAKRLFDIMDDGTIWYDDTHIAPPEALKIVLDIQEQQRKIIDWVDKVANSR